MNATTLRSHLETEVERLHNQRRNTTIIGIVLVLIVIGYMSWLNSFVTDASKPENIADFTTGVVRANLPRARQAAVDMVKSEGPNLARFVGQSLSDELPRVMRETVRDMVIDYSDELAVVVIDRYNKAFSAMLKEAKGEISAVLTDGLTEQDRARMIGAVIEKQVKFAIDQLNAVDTSKDDTLAKLAQSHVALANLNLRLQDLMDAKPRKDETRQDKLTRRFLGTFWRYVQQQNPEAKVDPAEGQPEPKGK
jgi:hypothetical protein